MPNQIPKILNLEELVSEFERLKVELNTLISEHKKLKQDVYNHVYDSPGIHASPFSHHWQRQNQ